jgi:hypothetical protein
MVENGCYKAHPPITYRIYKIHKGFIMSITTTGSLGPMILQSLAPAMLYVPTPTMNYITICDKVSMPANGGTTCRFMRPRALQPPTVQLGNSGIDPPAQVPQRDIIDAQMAFFGTGCIINEQVILQDQEGVLAWVSERLAVAMRQAEDLILRDYIVSAASQLNAGGGSNGDNPTNIGMSDFSLVATTLDKLCVEFKSLVIDLEARWGDRAQAEQYALAA